MKFRIILILSIIGLIFTTITQANALSVYLGLEIITLEDDPASSCAGVAGYGSQGRIRAISSILPWHPLFFNLTYQSNGTTVWSGNSTKNTDYGLGEIIFLPNSIDLQSGEIYNLMMDIDAIRIYLPLTSYGGFIETVNDEYWTAGLLGSGTVFEYAATSLPDTCTYQSTGSGMRQNAEIWVKNSRGNLIHSCMTDAISYNCIGNQYMGLWNGIYDWKIDDKYYGLYSPTVGNFNMQFTMP